MSTKQAASQVDRPLQVFLCHSSGDKAFVRDLYRRLREDGFAPWLDEEDLIPGQEWQEEIPRAVRASDAVIVCLSQESVTKEGYVQKEIKFSLDIAEEKPEGTVFIIPVRLHDVPVPGRLSKYQWADLFKDSGYHQLLRALTIRAKAIGITGFTPEAEAGKQKEAGIGGQPKAAQPPLRFVDLFSKLKPVRKIEHPWNLGTNAYRVMTIDWQVNRLRLIEQEDEYTGDGYLARDSLQTYIKNLERERAECGQGGLWRRDSDSSIERIDRELAEARVLLRKMNELQADAIDHLPKEFEGFPDDLRRLATELLMKDDTKGDLEISQFVIDNARSRFHRLPERTTSQKTAKQEKLENINELARRLGLY